MPRRERTTKTVKNQRRVLLKLGNEKKQATRKAKALQAEQENLFAKNKTDISNALERWQMQDCRDEPDSPDGSLGNWKASEFIPLVKTHIAFAKHLGIDPTDYELQFQEITDHWERHQRPLEGCWPCAKEKRFTKSWP
jgi:hypothetical protein